MTFRLLIADDEELERRAIRRILSSVEDMEIELREASNGREAVEIAEGFRPDIALLDIRMPGMNGIEVARVLRRGDPGIRCVFLTAFESFDYAREALRLGVDEYLLKPAEPEAVRETVRRAVERLRRERESANPDGERALALLETELRAALGRAAVEGGRLRSFLALRGLSSGDRVAVVVRPANGHRGDEALRRSTMRQLAVLTEKTFRDAGWFSLSGSDDSEARVVAARLSAADGNLASILGIVAERILAEIGLRVRIGASPSFTSDGPELFAAAQDAATLASENRPVVVLEPAAGEGDAAPSGGFHPGAGGGQVERAVELMRSRLAEDLSLADVAEHVGCSPFHLSRLFRLHAGDTFTHVFSRLRVEAAKTLLRTGQYSIKEVGSMVGFNDQAYFARVFKRFEGCAPAEYRASGRGSIR
jgi:two-component system response regulator YesN